MPYRSVAARSYRHVCNRLLTAAVSLAPLAVLAQDTAFSTDQLQPAETDVSVRLLHGVFGTVIDKIRLGDSLGTGDGGPFGGIFGLFNGFMILVVGFSVFVKWLVFSLNTGNEGELGGRDHSWAWSPLRLVAALALLLPLVNGFALIQIIVLWLTLGGIGLGNAVWDKAVDQFSKTVMYAEPPPAQARQLAVAMLASNVCELLVNDLPERGSTKYQIRFQGASANTGAGVYTERAVRWSADGLGEAVCGGFSVREPAEGIHPKQGYSGVEWMDGFMQWVLELVGFAEDTRAALGKELLAAHELAALSMRDELKPLAQNIFQGKGDLGECVSVSLAPSGTGLAGGLLDPLAGGRCLSAVDAAAEHYAARLKELVAGAINLTGQRGFTEFAARAKAEGWMTAGSWFYRLMALTEYMNKLSLNVPEPYPIRVWEKLPAEDVETYAHLFKRLEAVVMEAESDGGLGLTNGDPNNSALDDLSRGLLRHLFDWIVQTLLGKTHPLLAIAWIGHALIATVLTALGALGLAKLLATQSGLGRLGKALGGLADAIVGQNPSGPLTVTGLVLGMLVLALLGFALTAAILLPLLPFIIWSVAVLHWLLRVFEALAAGPVWALLFLKNGRGLMGDTTAGWMQLLSLLLTPALMVTGLLAATVLSYALLSLLSGLFVTAAINANSGNATGPVILVGLLVVFVLWALDLATRCFSLIHRLPDAALRWVGGHVEGALEHHGLQNTLRGGLGQAQSTGMAVVGQTMAGAPPPAAAPDGGKAGATVKPMTGGKIPD